LTGQVIEMDTFYCEIVAVYDIIKNALLRNNDSDDEMVQILKMFDQFRAHSPLPRCASCDAVMHDFPKKLVVFRIKGNPTFGTCGLCNKCTETMAPEAIIRAASASFSEEFAPAAGRA
jgi:uncharacterized protein with PIN domain